MEGKEGITSEEPSAKIRNKTPVGLTSFHRFVIYLACAHSSPLNQENITDTITSTTILFLPLFNCQPPTYTSHCLWPTLHCSCWWMRSLRMLVTIMFWLFVGGTQTLFHPWRTDSEKKWYVGKSRLPLWQRVCCLFREQWNGMNSYSVFFFFFF